MIRTRKSSDRPAKKSRGRSAQPIEQADRAREMEKQPDDRISAEPESRRDQENLEMDAQRGRHQPRFGDFRSFMISSGSGSLSTVSYMDLRRPSSQGSNSGSCGSDRLASWTGLRLGTLDRSATPASAHVPWPAHATPARQDGRF